MNNRVLRRIPMLGMAAASACSRPSLRATYGRTDVAHILRDWPLAAFALLCTAGGAWAVEPAAIPGAPGVYELAGTGGEITIADGGRVANVAFIIGPSGVVVVDTGISYRQGEEIIAAVRSVSSQPIRLAILTHPSQEVIFGAAAFQASGIPVLAQRQGAELIATRCDGCLQALKALLGDAAMRETRVVKPDQLIDRDETIDVMGRPLRVFASEWSSAPGAIAVFDESTSTLIAGSLVTIKRVPDLRDANPAAWNDLLVRLEATRCRHLVPAYGPVGTCADIAALRRYFDALEKRVVSLMNDGVSLAELRSRCDLPEFSGWDQYEKLHPQNANRVFLRLEQSQFK